MLLGVLLLVQNALLNAAYPWLPVRLHGQQIVFVARAAPRGPPVRRVMSVMIVNRTAVRGVKSNVAEVAVDCGTRVGWTLNRVERTVSGLEIRRYGESARALAVDGTLGGTLYPLMCGSKDLLDVAMPSMVAPLLVADRAFRLNSLGIDPDVAVALAACDPVRAPGSFKKILNIGVPTDLQHAVLAVMMPDASFDNWID